MDDKTAISWLKQIKLKYIHGGDEEFDKSRKEAIDHAIEILSAHCGADMKEPHD